jgi:hypothetical protein
VELSGATGGALLGTPNSATLTITDNDSGASVPHDFTADSQSDVLVRNSGTGIWYLYHMNGRNRVNDADTGSIAISTEAAWQTAGVADFNGDGQADVLVRDTGTGQWYLYALNGRTILDAGASGGVPMAADLAWQPVGIADFTGDGKADVLLRNTGTGQWYLDALDGRTIQGGGATGGVPMAADLNWQAVGVSDVSGDGKADVLLRNSSTGLWYLYVLDGRSIQGGGATGGVPMIQDTAWAVVAMTDITGDGKGDVLMRHGTSGAWYLSPLDGRTVLGTAGGVAMVNDTAWQTQQVEDFTGDGQADVLLRHTSTNAWFLYPLDGVTLPGGANQGDANLTGNASWMTQ